MKKSKAPCALQTCLVCRQCLPSWMPAVREHRRNFGIKKGAVLFREGDPVKGIFFLEAGTVKVHKHWAEGKELIVRFARAGDIVGHRGVGGDLTYPVTATAMEVVNVCYFDLDFFNDTLRVNHELLYTLMMFYAAELQESEKRMRNLAHMSVKGRLAYALLTLKNKFGYDRDGFIDLPLSRQDLASYIGATYETTFRMLAAMTADQLIATSGRSIALTDEKRLARLMEE
ncbi:Crp/Fnr family transcriptional regulator [Chitinophaga lutea]